MTVFEKLARRIKDDLGLEVRPDSLQRTYHGCWQLKAGGYSWIGYLNSERPILIGSCDTASDCVNKRYKLEMLEKNFNTEIKIFAEIIK